MNIIIFIINIKINPINNYFYKNKYNNLKGCIIKNICFDFDYVIHRNVDPDNGKDS